MSALGQKLIFDDVQQMSFMPPGIERKRKSAAQIYVRFVPEADLDRLSATGPLCAKTECTSRVHAAGNLLDILISPVYAQLAPYLFQ